MAFATSALVAGRRRGFVRFLAMLVPRTAVPGVDVLAMLGTYGGVVRRVFAGTTKVDQALIVGADKSSTCPVDLMGFAQTARSALKPSAGLTKFWWFTHGLPHSSG